MDVCFKCGRSEEEVRIFDGISINESVKTCEKCALIEGIPILKSPSAGQLRSSEKNDLVYRRLRKISGLEEPKEEKSVFEELHELEKNPELEKPEEKPTKFVDNFHWIIQRERRHKGLTHRQLAAAIGESEIAITLIERNNLPEDALPVVRKLEQFLRIKLVKEEPIKETESVIERRLEERGTTIEVLKQDDQTEQESTEEGKEPIEVLDFKKEKLKDITISDLREAHRLVEQDFPTKTREEVGREQTENFGKSEKQAKESTSSTSVPIQPAHIPKKSWSQEYFKKRERKIAEIQGKFVQDDKKVPSIAELAEKKKDREVQDEKGLVGSEIELAEEPSEQEQKSIKDAKEDEIEIIEEE